MALRERRLEILKQVEGGQIALEEGARRLAALETGKSLPEAEPEQSRRPEPAARPDPTGPVEVLRPGAPADKPLWWLLPILPGMILVAVSAYWMFLGWQTAGLSWGFWFSWVPFLIGLALIALGMSLRASPWLHIRINRPDRTPRQVAFSLPIPFGLAGWLLRTFRPWLPAELRDQGLDQALESLRREMTPDNPLQIQIDQNGEQLEIYLS